jgi:dihydrofolate reductase
MGELTVTTFVSVDGVMQAPGGPEEDTSAGFTLGGWTFPYFDEDMGAIVSGIFARAGAFLLGRTTYDIFAAYWPQVTDASDPVSTKLNALPKYVATRGAGELEWGPAAVVRDVTAEVPRIKEKTAGELQVHGSAGLVQTLIAHGLVDEYRLFTFPVVLGAGKRLFGSGAVPAALRPVETRTTGSGVQYAVFRPEGELRTGSFALE